MNASVEIEATLTHLLARELELSEQSVDPEASLSDFALDSLSALRIVGGLEDKLGMAISASVLFQYSTIRTLSAHLASKWKR